MADISKEDLRKEIAAILKDADLSSTSAKKVRQELEEKLEANFQSRKKEIDDLVMEFVNSKQEKKKGKKSESEGEEEEEEEEEESEEEKKEKRASTGKKPPAKKAKKSSEDESASEQSEGDSEEEYSPKKSKPIKTRKLPPKKKKGSESDSDEDWAKSKKSKKGNGSEGEPVNDFNYELITAFRDAEVPLTTLDHPVLKKFMSKYCGREIPDFATLIEQYGDIGLDNSDCDGDEGVGGGVKKGGGGYTKTLTLSPELAELVGKESMARHEVVQKVWAIIKEKDLYDPKNKQYAICDDALMKVIGVKRFRTFGMMKYLKNHFIS